MLLGADEAKQNLIIRLLLKQLIESVPLEQLGGATLVEYSQQITSDQLTVLLREILSSPAAQDAAAEVLTQLAILGLESTLERTAIGLLDQMDQYISDTESLRP